MVLSTVGSDRVCSKTCMMLSLNSATDVSIALQMSPNTPTVAMHTSTSCRQHVLLKQAVATEIYQLQQLTAAQRFGTISM